MIQSFHTQLQVTLRALREVVAPAVASTDKVAVEQLHLSMATLQFMQARLPYLRRYCRGELQHHVELGGRVQSLVGGQNVTALERLANGVGLGKSELTRPEADADDYQRVTRELREAIADIVAESAGQPHEARLDALIIEATNETLLRERVWCLPLGFELHPEALPDLDSLLRDGAGPGST